MNTAGDIQYRTYGNSGPLVIVVHGGPATPGSIAPAARGLAGCCRIIEPWQCGSGSEPLTVAQHIEDLHKTIEQLCGTEKPILVGHSWGAMLILAYAAAHPDTVRALVLIGCGTFDLKARARMQENINARIDENMRQCLQNIEKEITNPGERLKKKYEVIKSVYSYDPISDEKEEPVKPFDQKAHKETWDDMLREQGKGVYPAAFASIKIPVLMIHGSYDPHPGKMILESLQPYIPHIQYCELDSCGHDPWYEKQARTTFFETVQTWLQQV
jgi:pimeloyl-ACP methyl ester carboxylesterase